ncbi:MAG: IS3 family transposase [Eggerthellaceae bacterium]|nr:IS3 family transposase [Eggerthellaceae bacterium]
MKNGKFTPAERQQLLRLDAVDEVRAKSIVYSKQFKEECMARYHAGERPADIFASAGLPSSLIGYKRIERAICHWKEAERKGALCATDAPQVRHRNQVDTIKRAKRKAVERQRLMRDRERQRYEARIAELEAQVEVLKAESALAKKCGRAGRTLTKSERFALIAGVSQERPRTRISAMCQAMGVSRSGYYKWRKSAPARAAREAADLEAKEQVEQAFLSHGFKKGSRQVRDSLRRDQGVVMNLKKVQRIMRKFGIVFKRKRKNPYHPIGADGLPKVAPNVLDRNFHQGALRKVLVTDITYMPCREGFSYLSAILDAESDELIGHVVSLSLQEEFVLETFDQIKGEPLAPGALAHSDQGVHYMAKAYRAKLAELGLVQSMSRRACCWDNACMESWFGRMKEQIGPTSHMAFAEVCEKVDEYIEYYNYHRGQERLNWMTPKEYAAAMAA